MPHSPFNRSKSSTPGPNDGIVRETHIATWKWLWHALTVVSILIACYIFHAFKYSSQQNLIERMDKLVADRKASFKLQMEELNLSHEEDIVKLKVVLAGQLVEERTRYRNELNAWDAAHQEAVVGHRTAMDLHSEEATKLQKALDTNKQYTDTYKAINEAADVHHGDLETKLNTCKADVAKYEEELKGREGAEVSAALKELQQKMASLRTKYYSYLEMKSDSILASSVQKEINHERLDVRELKQALEAVLKAPQFAPKVEREPIIHEVALAEKLLTAVDKTLPVEDAAKAV